MRHTHTHTHPFRRVRGGLRFASSIWRTEGVCPCDEVSSDLCCITVLLASKPVTECGFLGRSDCVCGVQFMFVVLDANRFELKPNNAPRVAVVCTVLV